MRRKSNSGEKKMNMETVRTWIIISLVCVSFAAPLLYHLTVPSLAGRRQISFVHEYENDAPLAASREIEATNTRATSWAAVYEANNNTIWSTGTQKIQRNKSISSRTKSARDEKLWKMGDMLIMARAYLLFASQSINSRLVRELKLRIKEIENIINRASKDSDLHRSVLQKMNAMEASLVKANKAYPDCTLMVSKLQAMTRDAEEHLRSQENQVAYLFYLAASTVPKGLHCLTMQLTSDYFLLPSNTRNLPNTQKVQKMDLYHYAIFSDNVLACAVVVNSTIFTAMEPEKLVFHVVTDSLNFSAMKMWFIMNQPGQATIEIKESDNFKLLFPDHRLLYKELDVRDRIYAPAFSCLWLYLPEIFPDLNKILLLDHDVVVQRDLRGLWDIDMKGKINGAVTTCREGDSSNLLGTFLNFSDPVIRTEFDPNSCKWAFGMNMFDLQEWRRQGLIDVYHNWLQLGKKRRLWNNRSLPLDQLTFYNHTLVLDSRWHLLGLGHDSNVRREDIERAAVIHYNGNMKPWLDAGIQRYRIYWEKFLNYNHPHLRQCNIHQ